VLQLELELLLLAEVSFDKSGNVPRMRRRIARVRDEDGVPGELAIVSGQSSPAKTEQGELDGEKGETKPVQLPRKPYHGQSLLCR